MRITTISLLITLFSCHQDKPQVSQLGDLTFEVTASEEAKPVFLKGLLLLHSFEYRDAAETFIEAQQKDPSCVMAYWGEAMSYNHSLWAEQDEEKGKLALQRFGETSESRLAKTKTELEGDFLSAVEILYGSGTKPERDKAYCVKMEDLYRKYPGNNEVAAFYALSLLGSVPVGRDVEIYQKGSRIAEGILKENPKHPGALHYIIHANDDPEHAAKAVEVAHSYSNVAPDAGHALHMPSHIYVALGMWDDVVRSNEESWQVSVDRMSRKGLNNDARGYHYFHWLEYGYLQRGQFEKAKTLVDSMSKYCSELPSEKGRAHMIYMKSTYLVDSEDWDHPISNDITNVDDLNISTRSLSRFIEGMKGYYQNDVMAIENVISEMESDRMAEKVKLNDDGIVVCSAGASRETSTSLDIDQSFVMELELRGMLALAKSDKTSAEKFFKEAVQKENATTYSYGPPIIAKPSYELYGEFLLDVKRPREALDYFDMSLKRAPKRVLSLQGAMYAAEMLGDLKKKSEYEKTILDIRKNADILPLTI